MNILRAIWLLLRDTLEGFVEDNALSRGGSIAYFTLFSIAPVLLVVIAIAGLAYGQDAAEGAIVKQLSGLMGQDTATALQSMIEGAGRPREGMIASIVGLVVLVIAVTGVFGEVQSAMNQIWKASAASHSTLSRLVRARLVSLGLVVTAGFLLMVSRAASAALASLSNYLRGVFPTAEPLLNAVDILMSIVLINGLFAVMFKTLPDTDISWRDVGIGALASTTLF